MSASLEDAIQKKVRQLADEQQQEVLEFVEILEKRAQNKPGQLDDQGIDLVSYGIDENQAFELRANLTTFEDWNDREMDIYDNYDQHITSREKKI